MEFLGSAAAVFLRFKQQRISQKLDTVDGSEIWRSPVEVGSLFSHYLRRVLYIPGGWEWDF